ncbi:MAG: Aminoglycoside phosphotransferase [Pseudomonadota bacterium]
MSRMFAEVVDLDVLTDWMDSRGLETGSIEEPELITGGTQNILMRFRRGNRSFVFRRPPPHKRANSDETMRREARVLAALAGTAVPHPALVDACPDEGVLGAAFYLMEPVDGFNPSLGLPPLHEGDRAVQRRMGFAMPEAIAALAAVDFNARGLADLGKFDGWAERQVGRWRKQLDSYSALPGYPGPDIPGVDDVGRWLEERRPADARPGLIHGDFHFANVLFRHDGGELAAVVDWELVTIGDPLLDLGHLLCSWPRRGITSVVGFNPPGLPSQDEVIAHYAAHSSRDLGNLLWYRVLACYRLGLILEGTHARACAGLAPKETGDRLHASTVSLFEQALELIG